MKISLLVGACTACLLACAGKLEDPERFAATVKKFDAKPAVDAGKPSSTPSTDEDGGAVVSMPDAGVSLVAPTCATTLFKNSCALVGCHAKGSPQVDLASPDVALRLIDKASSGPKCSGRVFISTVGGPNLLIDKLNDPPPCGDKMPLGGSISDTDRSCLVDWVKSVGGAVADGGLE